MTGALDGRIALVTGAGRGIGAACVRSLDAADGGIDSTVNPWPTV